MAVKLAPNARRQFLNASGVPYSGAKLFYYAAGSSTKQNTYTTSTGGVANSNPIILDSAGRTPYGVWFTEGLTYKEVLAPSNDTDPPTSPIFTEDGISGVNDTNTVVSEWIASGLTPTYVSSTSFTVPGDNTSELHIGRRLKFSVNAGTVYGRITASAYTTLTTVTMVMDSGTLDSGLSSFDMSILSAVNNPIPKLTGSQWDAIGVVNNDSTQTIAGNKTFTGVNVHSGANSFTSTVDLSGATLSGSVPLVFEGATANAFETSILVTDPTADRTITIPNADVDLTLVRAATTALTGVSRFGTNTEQLAGLLSTVGLSPAGLASGVLDDPSGYFTFPKGVLVQWGNVPGSTNVPGTTTVTGTFPKPFTSAVWHVFAIVNHADAIDDLMVVWKRSSTTLSQPVFVVREITTGVQTSWDVSFLAIGK